LYLVQEAKTTPAAASCHPPTIQSTAHCYSLQRKCAWREGVSPYLTWKSCISRQPSWHLRANRMRPFDDL